MGKVTKNNYKASNGKLYRITKKDKKVQQKVDALKSKWASQKTTIDYLNS
jgi:hypothetical protein